MQRFKFLKVFLIAILIIGIATPMSTEAATVKSGNLMNINKTVSNNAITKGETTDVTLTVKGTPQDSTFVKPNDVILIVDKSGSMQADNRIAAAKEAAKEFIELMDLTKHEVGIVDYSTNATSFPLTTDKDDAKAYVDTIQLGGSTNTSAAIRLATTMLANHRADAQPTIVIMTDGEANNTADAIAAAKAAKDAGITFYTIALLAPNEDADANLYNQLLKEMASSFDHHHFVLGSVGLSDVYRQIVEEIGLASAYNVTITDTVSPEFEIVPGSYDDHIPRPTVTGNTIEWNISELKTNELSFTYQVRAKDDATAGKYPVAQTSTTFETGDGTTYSLDSTNPIVEVLNHAPIITSIADDKGITAGGETVTITGQNFLPNAKVFFGAKLATIVSETETEIVVTTPTGAQGPVVVKVENTDKQVAVGDFNYYADPTITSISPNEGPLEGGTSVTINGSDYLRGAIVYFNDVEAVTTFVKAGTVRAIAPPASESGAVTVKVVNPDNTSVEQVDAYMYLAPPPAPELKLISLSPTSGELIGGTSIIITGENFDRNVKVYLDDIEATTTFLSQSSVRVIAPQASTPGFVSVKAENPDGMSDVLTDAYEYLAPPPAPEMKLISLSPTSGELIGGTSIIITGENFDQNVKVYLDDIEATTTFLNQSSVRVIAPQASTPGFVSVKAENPDGISDILTDAYEYLAPPPAPELKLTSLSSTSGELKGGTATIITGENFDRNVKVYFGDIEATTTFLSNTSVRAIVPEGVTIGFISVKAENPDGMSDILTDAYEYIPTALLPAPEITSLSEDTLLTGETKQILIYGNNFAKTSKAFFGEQEVTMTYLSKTRVRVVVPASSTPGVVDVKVLNVDGQITVLQNGFTYTEPVPEPAPIITSLSSTAGSILGREIITITGQNFKPRASVYFGDKLGRVLSISDTEIRVETPVSSQTGLVSVKVVNVDLQEAVLQDSYLYEGIQPTITSLSSNNGAATGKYAVIIYGTNFSKTMTLTVDSEPVSFTYLANNRIRIIMPAGSPGVVDITIDLEGQTVTEQFTYN